MLTYRVDCGLILSVAALPCRLLAYPVGCCLILSVAESSCRLRTQSAPSAECSSKAWGGRQHCLILSVAASSCRLLPYPAGCCLISSVADSSGTLGRAQQQGLGRLLPSAYRPPASPPPAARLPHVPPGNHVPNGNAAHGEMRGGRHKTAVVHPKSTPSGLNPAPENLHPKP